VAINAQIVPGSGAGGVEYALIGLVHALGQLNDGPEEYVIIGPWLNHDWLKPYIGPNERIVRGPRKLQQLAASVLGPLRPAAARSRDLLSNAAASMRTGASRPDVPKSNGFYESLDCAVIHFPYQHFTLCALPSVYCPHDLQHIHYPQFFAPSLIAWREAVYRTGCRSATTTVALSAFGKRDIVQNYGLEPDRVQVIPWAAPTQAYAVPSSEAIDAVRTRYHLEHPFALYPAITWPHKNHVRLLEALALLRDRSGLTVHLICTGQKGASWPDVVKRVSQLNLQGQVKFLGLVPAEHLRALYQTAQFVVFPTLFEGAGLPLLEAWQDGAPVACSGVTSLPEYAGGASLFFDPASVQSIADAVARMSTDSQLRDDLCRRGKERSADFSWERTAKAYRAVYRRAAGWPLTEEDHWLLAHDFLRDAKKEPEVKKP
jgi:glycosyltransferase involved in cell wall biosynthesis